MCLHVRVCVLVHATKSIYWNVSTYRHGETMQTPPGSPGTGKSIKADCLSYITFIGVIKFAFEGSVEHYYSIIYVTFAKNVMTYSSGSAFREHILLFMPHLIQVFGLIYIWTYVTGSWVDRR